MGGAFSIVRYGGNSLAQQYKQTQLIACWHERISNPKCMPTCHHLCLPTTIEGGRLAGTELADHPVHFQDVAYACTLAIK